MTKERTVEEFFKLLGDEEVPTGAAFKNLTLTEGMKRIVYGQKVLMGMYSKMEPEQIAKRFQLPVEEVVKISRLLRTDIIFLFAMSQQIYQRFSDVLDEIKGV